MTRDQNAPGSLPAVPPPPTGQIEDAPVSKPETPIHDLLRFLYSSNPFYVISAGLIFFGLRSSFDTAGDSFESNALMIGLSGYVILLALSACFLIRVGKVWDDVRSMLLLVVLMCLAISVCFDDALATNPATGAWYYYAGFVFTALVSEGLLRGLPLRLPAVFRVPYYSILALFFFYPVLLSPLVGSPDDPRLHWGLFGFSTAAGLVFLTLLPAARLGPHVVREDDSPWPWPWYPWVLFGTLALGILGRAYYLCISMHFVVGKDSIFGPYFWIPFLLVLNLLLLEVIQSCRRSALLPCLTVIPTALLAITITGPSKLPVHLGFAETFTNTIGATPLFCTAVAIAVFYGYCVLRRVPRGADFLSAWLLLFCVVGRPTIDPATLTGPIGLPFVLVALIQVVSAIHRRSALRGALATLCVMIGAAIGFRDALLTAHGGFVVFHLLLGIVLLTGAIAHHRFGRFLQYAGAALLTTAGVAAVILPGDTIAPPVSSWLDSILPIYPYLALAVALSYGYFVSNGSYYGSAALILGVRLSGVGWQSYVALRRTVEGLDYLFFGFLFFLVAMLISLSKAGLLRAARQRPVEEALPADDPSGK